MWNENTNRRSRSAIPVEQIRNLSQLILMCAGICFCTQQTEFLSGVLELGDALDAMNTEGRLETVELNETNQSFLRLCRSVKEQELSEQDAYTVLTLAVMSSDEDAQ